MENISGFSSVIAVRMHANIIAFSLGIPSVAFVWNDKLRFFGQSIGYPDRFIEYDKISDAGYVMDVFEKACKEGCSQKILDREKDSAYASVKDFFVPFSKELLSCRRRDLTNVKFVCYGLPNLNSPKLNTELFETLPTADLITDKGQQHEDADKESNIIIDADSQEQRKGVKDESLML